MNKKIFIPVLLSAVLSSCAARNTGEGRIVSDDFVFITTAPMQAARLSEERKNLTLKSRKRLCGYISEMKKLRK